MKAARILALIPARGGSKGIPGKNIKLLGGRPLIAYSIAAAKASSFIERTIVSTDDAEIARVATALGAEVPFRRPAELAGDSVTDLPVFQHALLTLATSDDYRPDIVVHLRPTSPLRPPGLVDGAIRTLLENPDADSVRSVAPPNQNPYKMWRTNEGRLEPLLPAGAPEPYNAPRQSLPETYWQTGQVDVMRAATINEKRSVSGDRILPYPAESAFAVDLDSLPQWALAEHLIQAHGSALVVPEDSPLALARRIRLVVSDFDGVLTDNRVWLSQDGRESVACSREDGLGISHLQAAGIPFAIISTEANPVVLERAKKLKVRCYQRVRRKREVLVRAAREEGVPLEEVAYIGNDVNDLEAFAAAGLAVAVADARPELLREAHLVLKRCGGRGAVREFCDLILAGQKKEDS
ncbi:MAG TPA: acylneuraminate cytidylyltransferase [Terriglobales bacterium]|nr:acylneuraminate cytidylyltransferase [Terriglobales bacterium]